MDELLGNLRAEGRHDSEGNFTLAFEPALRKLAERQFELPGMYLLKMIQAAVAFGAFAIRVNIGSSVVRFLADLYGPLPGGLERLAGGPFQQFESPALRHLAWAWAAVAALSPQRAELFCGGRRLRIQDGRMSVSEEEPFSVLYLELDKGLKWWQRLLAWRAAEVSLMAARAGYCPVPLMMDGLYVDGGEPHIESGTRAQCLVFRVGGGLSATPPLRVQARRVSISGAVLALNGARDYRWKWPEAIEPIELAGEFSEVHRRVAGEYLLGLNQSHLLRALAVPMESARRFLGGGTRAMQIRFSSLRAMDIIQRVPICWAHLFTRPGPSKIYPCQHGVLLDPVEVDLGASAIVTADHLETDLSQLKIVQDERWDSLVADLRAEVDDFRRGSSI